MIFSAAQHRRNANDRRHQNSICHAHDGDDLNGITILSDEMIEALI